MNQARASLDDRFDTGTLDLDVWFPYYLPHWSSRAASAATWSVDGEGLHLTIPSDQPLWCPDLHAEPLRVSCIQSGSFAGPLGSPIGQLSFQDGLVVREEQPVMWGYTPWYGRVEVRMRGVITDRSMIAFWMSGIEDQPERCGEICVAEIFGDAVADGRAAVGMGIKAFRDPLLTQAFSADPIALDVAELHTYGVDWRPGSLELDIDGEVVRRLDQAPDYPLQLMIGVFDFPAHESVRSGAGGDTPVPELVLSHVRGHPLD
jgi:hypothetical protein